MRISLFTAVCVLLLGISLFGNFFQWRAAQDFKPETQYVPVATAAPAQPAQVIVGRYVAKDSTRHALVAEQVRTRKTAEKQTAVGKAYLDSVAAALAVSVKQVDEVSRTNATLLAENIQLKATVANPKKQEYRDRWLRIVYDADSNQIDSLAYDVELTHARYWNRPWLLGDKRYYNDVFSPDPRVTINAARRFTLPEPRPRKFGIGIQAGYGFTFDPSAPFALPPTWPYLGVGLSYNFIRF